MNVKDTTQAAIQMNPGPVSRPTEVVRSTGHEGGLHEQKTPMRPTDQFESRMRAADTLTGDRLPAGTSRGLTIAPALREKLEPFLKARPKKGFGYIIAQGDVLDQLLDEAYEDGNEDESHEDRLDRYIAAFLMYNRHLGLSTPEALTAAVGQLLYFPEMQELIDFHGAVSAGANPLNFPALETFLQFAGLPPEAATQFHWVAPRLATSTPASNVRITRPRRNSELELRSHTEKRGSGVRTKSLKTANITTVPRTVRVGMQPVISLLEDARLMIGVKPRATPIDPDTKGD